MQFIPFVVLFHLIELPKTLTTSENDYPHHISDYNSNAFCFSFLNTHDTNYYGIPLSCLRSLLIFLI